MLLTVMLLHHLHSLFSDGSVYSGLGPPTLRTNQENASTDISQTNTAMLFPQLVLPFPKWL